MSRNVSSQNESVSSSATDASPLYDRSGRRKYLNTSERTDAIAAMTALPTDKALFALTLAWTGARVSEVLALGPESFQIERQLVTIRTLKRRRHSAREVPIPKELALALDSHFGLTRHQRADPHVNSRLWPWHRVTAWRIVKSAMKDARVVGTRSSPRGLRHGFGIGALQAAVPLNLVQRWLGHARMSTTAIYADASGPEELAFASRFWHQPDHKSWEEA